MKKSIGILIKYSDFYIFYSTKFPYFLKVKIIIALEQTVSKNSIVLLLCYDPYNDEFTKSFYFRCSN